MSRRDFLAAAAGLTNLPYAPLAAGAPDGGVELAKRVATLPDGVSCEGLRIADVWQIRSSLIFVCGYGSDPLAIGNGRRRGSGLSFRHVRAEHGTEHLLENSEAEFDVDYWTDESGLHVVQYTLDSDVQQIVPLLEHRFEVSTFPAHRSLSIMLRVPPNARDCFVSALSALRGPRTPFASDMVLHLCRIRDFGLVSPDQALTVLDGLRGAWWDDGEVAEHATAVRRELELLAKALVGRVA